MQVPRSIYDSEPNRPKPQPSGPIWQVPRSIYDSSQSFADIGGRVFNGIRDIFTNRRGLGARETHHMFCRLLGAQVVSRNPNPETRNTKG